MCSRTDDPTQHDVDLPPADMPEWLDLGGEG